MKRLNGGNHILASSQSLKVSRNCALTCCLPSLEKAELEERQTLGVFIDFHLPFSLPVSSPLCLFSLVHASAEVEGERRESSFGVIRKRRSCVASVLSYDTVMEPCFPRWKKGCCWVRKSMEKVNPRRGGERWKDGRRKYFLPLLCTSSTRTAVPFTVSENSIYLRTP